MRSQKIRTRNLPETKGKTKTVHLRPTAFLTVLLVIGAAFLFLPSPWAGFGIWMVLLSLFGLIIMPNRKLCQFTEDYLILYNLHDQEECTILYWNEIVNWQYEWHPYYDQLDINMIDGSTETQEMFAKRSVARYLNRLIPGKEVKNIRRRSS
jgi:hypothetical protein